MSKLVSEIECLFLTKIGLHYNSHMNSRIQFNRIYTSQQILYKQQINSQDLKVVQDCHRICTARFQVLVKSLSFTVAFVHRQMSMAEASRHSVLSPLLSLLSPTDQNVSCVLTAKKLLFKRLNDRGNKQYLTLRAAFSLWEWLYPNSCMNRWNCWEPNIIGHKSWHVSLVCPGIMAKNFFFNPVAWIVPIKRTNVAFHLARFAFSWSTVAFFYSPGAAHRQQKESYGELSLTYVGFVRTSSNSASILHVLFVVLFFHKSFEMNKTPRKSKQRCVTGLTSLGTSPSLVHVQLDCQKSLFSQCLPIYKSLPLSFITFILWNSVFPYSIDLI